MTFIIIIFLITFLIIVWVINKDSNSHSNDSGYSNSELEPADVINKVKDLKKLAWDKRVPEKLMCLFELTKHYPDWFNNGNKTYVCSDITEAKENTLKDDEEANYCFTLKTGGTFHILLKRTSFFDGVQYGDIQLIYNESKVIQVSLTQDLGIDYSEWEPLGIDAFINGAWIDIIENFLDLIDEEKELREKESQHSPERIEKLKKDFGIK